VSGVRKVARRGAAQDSFIVRGAVVYCGKIEQASIPRDFDATKPLAIQVTRDDGAVDVAYTYPDQDTIYSFYNCSNVQRSTRLSKPS
jgi:hypothetical protein